MKKRILAVLTAVAMLMTFPLSVACDSELSDVQQSGSTAVEADIVDSESGAVSYIVSIPDKIDFGTLQMPEDSNSAHPKDVNFTVEAVLVSGLDTATHRVAVLMKDANAASGTFQITGTGNANSGKTLEYSVLSATGQNITIGNEYSNGFLFTAFSATGQSVTGTLSLEQNQLREDPIIENWAGYYFGTINFYTAVARLSDYM